MLGIYGQGGAERPRKRTERTAAGGRFNGGAEVTEGNPWPIGYVWERLRYDWSDPRALRGRVIDSNLFKRGSTWELWATPEDGGSQVEIRAVRHLRGRGWLLAPFFLPFIPGSAARTVRDHLGHFLANIEAPDPKAGEGS